MKNKDKTHEQLIKEVTSLRQRIAELEASGRKRNQFEEALRTERDKAQQYLDIAEVILIALNKKGAITLINKKGNQILGYREGELLGKNWFTTCVPSRLRKKIKNGFQKLMAGERQLTEFYENPVLTKTGAEKMMAWHNALLKDAQGNPIGTLSSGEDITDRKRAEETLKESESKFRNIMGNSKDGIIFFDGKTRKILFGNRAMAELLGCTEGDLIGRSIPSLHPPEEWASVEKEFLKHVSGEISLSAEIPVIRNDGSVFYADISSSFITLDGRSYFAAFFRDITERKQAEEALRKERDFAESIIETAQAIVLVLDTEGRIVHFNSYLEKLSGYRLEEVRGKNWFTTFLPKRDRKVIQELFLKAIGEKRTHGNVNSIVTKENQERLIEWHDITLKDATGKANGLLAIGMDVTDRKQAEETLIRINKAVDSASDAIGISTAQGHHFYHNKAFTKLFEYSPEELEVAGGGPAAYANKNIAREVFDTIMSGESWSGEVEMIAKSGLKFPVQLRADAIKDESGKIIGLIGVHTDITERKQAEEALRDSEERFRFAFENANTGVCLVNLEGNLTRINSKMCEIFGYTREELESMTVNDIAHPEDVDLSTEFMQKTLRGEIDRATFEKRYIHKKGHVVTCEVSSSLVRKAEGTPLYFISHINDITERKQAEEALRESETRFRTLFEAIPDTVLVHDDKGNILHINEIGAQQLEWSAKDLIGRNLREIVTPENAAAITDHVRETHKVGWSRFETTYVSRSGWRTLAEVYEHPIVFDKKKAILSVARDITERKQAEEKLRASEEKYRDLVENINDIIYAVDEHGIITYIAPTIESISGYTTSEIIGRPFFDFIYEKDVPHMKDVLQRDISGQAEPHEYRMKIKAGDVRWVRTFSRPFFEGDRLMGLRGVLTDITDRKQAEEALLAEKMFSDTIMDSSPGLFFVFDDQGNILRWNQNAEKFTEYSTQEISKMNVLDFVAQEDKKSAAEAIQEVINKGQASVEINILSKSGNKTPFYLTGLRTKIEDITCVVGSGFDISERKQAEEALQRSYNQLQETFTSSINALASTVEMKDQYTAGHQPRVTQLACAIADEMGLSEAQIEGIRMASIIHDIGKIVVPAEILNKPGPLTEVQYEMIKMHPQAGYDILKRIAFPWPVAQIVQQHHEMMDGSGYPQGLSGEEILLEARIMAVANVVEAMTAHRPYRPAYHIKEALAEISQHRGVKYDPAAADACLRLFTERGFVFDSAQY